MASSPNTARDAGALCAPIVKWPGGKAALLARLMGLLPDDIGTRRYVEPFAGGAALYFALQPKTAVLSDINAQLMATYQHVRTDCDLLIEELTQLQASHSESQYYSVRAKYNATSGDTDKIERAAQFIYLNKTGFNGLHRVNRRGEFNVPSGKRVRPCVVNPARMRAAAAVLRRANVRTASFEEALEDARATDFVYLDPPYWPTSKASFTAYAGRFGATEQKRLAQAFRALDDRGCKLMLSNSACADVRRLYRGYRFHFAHARRAIGCKASGRGIVREFVITNY